MSGVSDNAGGTRRPWWRQPFVHFLAAGAVLFLVDAWRGGSSDGEATRSLTVGPATVERLAERFQKREGRQPTASERRSLIDEYVREEVLYREALKLGLHRSDPIVRRRLVQAMRFLTEDMTPVEEPSESQLESYFESNRSDYAAEPRYSIRTVFYRADGDRDIDWSRELEAVRQERGWRKMGDPFVHGRSFERVQAGRLERIFGESFVRKMVELPVGRWEGPVPSTYGEHLVLVTERVEPSEVDWRDVRREVRSDWKRERREELNREAVERLRDDYDVSIEASGSRR